MKQIEMKEIDNMNLEEYDKYCIFILQNIKRNNDGNIINIEIYNHRHWERCYYSHFNFVGYNYRIIPEEKKRTMDIFEFVEFCEKNPHIYITGIVKNNFTKFEYGRIDPITQYWHGTRIEALSYTESLKNIELKKFEIEE